MNGNGEVFTNAMKKIWNSCDYRYEGKPECMDKGDVEQVKIRDA